VKYFARVKLKALEETLSFYRWKLRDKSLTEKERSKFLKALKLIEKCISEKEESEKKLKRFIAYDNEVVFPKNGSGKRGY